MKFLTSLPALLLTAVSVGAVEGGQDLPREAHITNFSANTLPHGTGAFASFNIDFPDMLSTRCTYADSTSTGRLPVIGYIPCDATAVEWRLFQVGGPPPNPPYMLVVLYTNAEGVKVGAGIELPADDFPVVDAGSSAYQHYSGPGDFTISNFW